MASPLRPADHSSAAAFRPAQDEDFKSNDPAVQQAARRQLSPQRAAEAPHHFSSRSYFPVSDFQRALKNLDYPEIRSILDAFGWTDEDLDRVKMTLAIKKKEIERYGKGFEALNLEPSPLKNLDEVVYPLLSRAIEKRFFLLLPSLPRFSPAVIDTYPDTIANLAADMLFEDPTDASFDVFKIILMKYPPSDLKERIVAIHEDLEDDSELQRKLVNAFPACFTF